MNLYETTIDNSFTNYTPSYVGSVFSSRQRQMIREAQERAAMEAMMIGAPYLFDPPPKQEPSVKQNKKLLLLCN